MKNLQSKQLAVHIQYRNGTYYGSLQNYQRNGYGLLIQDNSSIILGKWNKNKLNGEYVYINDKIRGIGNITNDRLEGYNIIIQKQQPYRTIYGMFRDDKLYGKSVIINKNEVMIVSYIKGQIKEIIQRKFIKDKEVYSMLRQTFPSQLHTLHQNLLNIIKDAQKINHLGQYYRYQTLYKQFRDYSFYGYIDTQQIYNHDTSISNNNKLFGFVMEGNKIVSIGEHNSVGQLQGIGRLYSNDIIQDGMFKGGELKGIGITYTISADKHSVGQNDGKKILQKGFGFPHKQISQIRKQFHLRSIYFYNDIAIIGLNNQLKTALSYAFQFGFSNQYQQRQISPRFSSIPGGNSQSNYRVKSPLNEKLKRYQKQSERLDNHYPTQYSNQRYKYLDPRKTTKQINSGQQQQSYDSQIYKVQQFDQTRTPYNYNKQPNRQSRNKSNNKSKQREYLYQKQINDTGYRKTNGYDNKYKPQKMDRRSSAQKDTRQLVRQLQQEERQKRIDIDKIYKQGNAYRRK